MMYEEDEDEEERDEDGQAWRDKHEKRNRILEVSMDRQK